MFVPDIVIVLCASAGAGETEVITGVSKEKESVSDAILWPASFKYTSTAPPCSTPGGTLIIKELSEIQRDISVFVPPMLLTNDRSKAPKFCPNTVVVEPPV
jgi:hypothetical protein